MEKPPGVVKLLAMRLLVLFSVCSVAWASRKGSCRFAQSYTCQDFSSPDVVNKYLEEVMDWEGRFAQPGIAYDPLTGYTYDGHPIDYDTGELYGEPHPFSAPSKESIHLSILALAVDGNALALRFVGGIENAIDLLETKIKGYSQFNSTYPGYGCFTPWVSFNPENGTIMPAWDWSDPYRVPGLDNGEWFWSIYATAISLEKFDADSLQAKGDQRPTNLMDKITNLAKSYRSHATCQASNAKTIFYRGEGTVSAVVDVLDPFSLPFEANYKHSEGSNYLDDPYEGETMTFLLYLFGEWKSEDEKDMLWIKKRPMLQRDEFVIPDLFVRDGCDRITVQKGYWFSTHEQWKLLLLPYLNADERLKVIRKVFANAEKARVWDAHLTGLPGLLASVNDVTDGSEDIPDYISASGVPSISFQEVERRDVITPYASFGLFLQNVSTGLCWYNNMLRSPRMQSAFGSIEAINVNGTEISPLVTWDSKVTTVLSMLGGVGHLSQQGLMSVNDPDYGTAYDRFASIIEREYGAVFGGVDDVLGGSIDFVTPHTIVSSDSLEDWELQCH